MQIVKDPKAAPIQYAVGMTFESNVSGRRARISAVDGDRYELTSIEPHAKSGKLTVTTVKYETLRLSWRRIRLG